MKMADALETNLSCINIAVFTLIYLLKVKQARKKRVTVLLQAPLLRQVYSIARVAPPQRWTEVGCLCSSPDPSPNPKADTRPRTRRPTRRPTSVPTHTPTAMPHMKLYTTVHCARPRHGDIRSILLVLCKHDDTIYDDRPPLGLEYVRTVHVHPITQQVREMLYMPPELHARVYDLEGCKLQKHC